MDSLKQLSIDDILNNEELQVEEIEDIKEPSVEEQIEMATKELNNKINDLTQQIYYREHENAELRKAMDEQTRQFERTIAALVYSIYGR